MYDDVSANDTRCDGRADDLGDRKTRTPGSPYEI